MKVIVLASWAPSWIDFCGELVEDAHRASHSVTGCAPGRGLRPHPPWHRCTRNRRLACTRSIGALRAMGLR
jgi:hypothetical protein